MIESDGHKRAGDATCVYERAVRDDHPSLQCAALFLIADMFRAMPDGSTCGAWTCRDAVLKVLNLFETQPTYAEDLVKVALHMPYETLTVATVAHPGGKLLCEVLLQVVNRGDCLQSRQAAQILAGCLALPNSEELLYTNDVRVLVEILLREIPRHAEDEEAHHAECLKMLVMRCPVARTHRSEDASLVLNDYSNYHGATAAVRLQCTETLR